MRVLVFAVTVAASIVWSWWSARFTFDAASHIRSTVIALLLMFAFCVNLFVPLVAVSCAAGFAFGPLSRGTQIATLVLGGLPMLVFSARHARRWKSPADDRASKA